MATPKALMCRVLGHRWYVSMRDVADINRYVRHCKRCGLREAITLPPLKRVA